MGVVPGGSDGFVRPSEKYIWVVEGCDDGGNEVARVEGGGKVGVYMCRLLSDDSKNANLQGDLDTEIGFRWSHYQSLFRCDCPYIKMILN